MKRSTAGHRASLRLGIALAATALLTALAPITAAEAAPPSKSDLEVVRIDPDSTPPGGRTELHAFIANKGPDRTANDIIITVRLPLGVTPEEPYFPYDCATSQADAGDWSVRCVFGAGLRSNRSATAIVPLRLSPELKVPQTLTGGLVSVSSEDDQTELSNNSSPFEIGVIEAEEGMRR